MIFKNQVEEISDLLVYKWGQTNILFHISIYVRRPRFAVVKSVFF